MRLQNIQNIPTNSSIKLTGLAAPAAALPQHQPSHARPAGVAGVLHLKRPKERTRIPNYERPRPRTQQHLKHPRQHFHMRGLRALLGCSTSKSGGRPSASSATRIMMTAVSPHTT